MIGVKTGLDISSVNKTKQEFTKLLADMQNQANRSPININISNTTSQINSINNSMNTLGSSANNTSSNFKNLGSSLGSLTGFYTRWLSVSSAVNLALMQTRNAIKFAFEQDERVRNVSMITGESRKEVQGYTKDWNDLALELKQSTSVVSESNEEWLRSGATLSEINELTKMTVKTSEIAGSNIKDTTSQAIALKNAYGMTNNELKNVLDSVVKMDNTSATGTDRLLRSLLVMSASAKQAKAPIDWVVAGLTTVQSKSKQTAESVGKNFRNIFLNMTKMTNGEDQIGLNKAEDQLNKLDISMRSSKDTFRSADKILDDLSKKWSTLTEVQQAELGTSLAQKENINTFNILMQNQAETLKNLNDIKLAGGSVDKAYEEHLISTKGALGELKATLEHLYTQLISGDTLKKVLNDLTSVVKVIEFLITDGKDLTKVWIGMLVAAKNFKLIEVGIMGCVTAFKYLHAFGLEALTLLSFNPIVLGFAAIAAVVATVTYTQYQHSKQVKELKQEYDLLNKSMSEMNGDEIKSNTEKLKEQQKELDKLASMPKVQIDLGFGVKDDGNQRNLDKYIKTLEDSGYTVDRVKNKIIELSAAESNIATSDSIKAIQDKTNATIEESTETQSLISQYMSLSQQENLSADKKALLSGLSQQLVGKVQGLTTSVDEHGNMVITNTKYLGGQIDVLELLKQQSTLTANVEIDNAIRTAQVISEGTIQTLDDMKKKLEGYNALSNALSNTKAGQGGFFATEQAALSMGTKNLEGSISKIESLKSKFNMKAPTLSGLTSSNPIGYKPTATGDKDKATKDKQDVANLETKTDRYYKLESALQSVETELDRLNKLEANANEEDKLKIKEKEIKLLDDKKIALQNIYREQQKENSLNAEILKKQGAKFDSQGNISNRNELLISKTNASNKLTGDAKKTSQESVKQFEEDIKNYEDVRFNKMSETSNKIFTLEQDRITKLKCIETEQLDKKLGNIDKTYNKESQQIADIQFKLDEINVTEDTNLGTILKKIDLTKDLEEATEDYKIQLLGGYNETSNLLRAQKEGSAEWEKTNSLLEGFKSKIKEGHLEVISLSKNTHDLVIKTKFESDEKEFEKSASKLTNLQNKLSTIKLTDTNGNLNILKQISDALESDSGNYAQKINDTVRLRLQAIKDGDSTKVFDDRIKDLQQKQFDNLNQQKENFIKEQEVLQKQYEETLNTDGMEAKLNRFNALIEAQNQKKLTLSETDYDKSANITEADLNINQAKANNIVAELYRLNTIIPKNKEQATQLRDAISKLKTELNSTNSSTVEYVKILEKIKLDKITKESDKFTASLDNQMAQLQNNIDLLDGGLVNPDDLSLEFTIPSGNVKNLQDYIKTAGTNIVDIEVDNYTTREEQANEYFKDIYAGYETHNKSVTDIVKAQDDNLEAIRSTTFTKEVDSLTSHGTNMETAMSTVFANYAKTYETSWDGILSILGGKLSTAKTMAQELLALSVSNSATVGSASNTSAKTSSIPHRANGGAVGGKSVVGEKGREIAVLPNGEIIVVGENGYTLMDFKAGTEIIPNDETEKILSQGGFQNVTHYENGTGMREIDLGFKSANGEKIKVVTNGNVSDSEKADMEKTYREYEARIIKAENDLKQQRKDDAKDRREDSKDKSSNITNNIINDTTNVNNPTITSNTSDPLHIDYSNSTLSKSLTDKYKSVDTSNESELVNFNYESMIAINENKLTKLKEAIKQLQDGLTSESLTKDTITQYQDAIVKYSQMVQDAQNKEKQIIKAKFDYAQKLREKDLKSFNDAEDDIQERMKLNELNQNDKDYGKNKLKISEELLKSAKEYNNELLWQALGIQSSMEGLKEGSFEWNILNDQVKEYGEQLEDSKYKVQELSKQVAEVNFDKMMDSLKSIKDTMTSLEYQKSLTELFAPEDSDSVNKISDKIIDSQKTEIDNMYVIMNQLREKQSLLEKNSLVWNTMEGQIESVVEQIRSASLAMAQLSKEKYGSYSKDFGVDIRKTNKAPKNSNSDDEGDWLEGLEKELEIKKIMKFVKENELILNKEQLAVVNSEGKIRKKNLDLVRNELELQQLQMKLENQKNEKNIQQLTKKEDGSFQFEYTFDQEAINKTEEDILNKQLDIVRLKKESDKEASDKAYENATEEYNKQLELLDATMAKAEARVYKTKEEFIKALQGIGLDLPIDEMVKKYWDYFLETATIYITQAVDLTKLMLAEQSNAFMRAGDESGKSYVEGISKSIETIMSGEGNIIAKQKSITDMLTSRYADFAIAGNTNGMSFVKGLIDSMGTTDFQANFNDVAISIKTKLESQVGTLNASGQTVGSAYITGLLGEMDKILADGSIENKTQTILGLLNKANEYGTLGKALGDTFMSGLITTFEASSSQITGDGEGVLSESISAIITQLDAKIADFAIKGELQGVAYSEALKVKLIEAMGNANTTQADIISILSNFKDFDMAGLLNGNSYKDKLLTGFGKAETGTKDKSSVIVAGLTEDIANFGSVGTAQGEAYSNAVTSAFGNAIASAKSIVGDLVAYVNSQNFNVNVGVKGNVDVEGMANDTPNVARLEKGGQLPMWGSNPKLAYVDEGEAISTKIDSKMLLKASELLTSSNFLESPRLSTKDVLPHYTLPPIKLPGNLSSSIREVVDKINLSGVSNNNNQPPQVINHYTIKELSVPNALTDIADLITMFDTLPEVTVQNINNMSVREAL